mmetsp:Transcript_12515/g.27922  ORF Transcript_12515/g.27922 Transcript_12515/m.27922 type:complete len:265 (+) Transcript_12515:532-1326(+)
MHAAIVKRPRQHRPTQAIQAIQAIVAGPGDKLVHCLCVRWQPGLNLSIALGIAVKASKDGRGCRVQDASPRAVGSAFMSAVLKQGFKHVHKYWANHIFVAWYLSDGSVWLRHLVIKEAAREFTVRNSTFRPIEEGMQAIQESKRCDGVRICDNQRHLQGSAQKVRYILKPAPPTAFPCIVVSPFLQLVVGCGRGTNPEVVTPLDVVRDTVHGIFKARLLRILRDGMIVQPNRPFGHMSLHFMLLKGVSNNHPALHSFHDPTTAC